MSEEKFSIPHLWTTNECAEFLRRSPRWLRSALSRPADDRGSVPHIRIGATKRSFPRTSWRGSALVAHQLQLLPSGAPPKKNDESARLHLD